MNEVLGDQPRTIVSLTLNAALDLSTSVERLEPFRKLRCGGQRLEPGGGGVNVARAITQLGGRALAVVALGGHVGNMVEELLVRRRVPVRRVEVDAATRQNFAVTEATSGQQYRFLVPMADALTEAEWSACLDATVDAAAGAGCVVASSSLPPGVPSDVFAVLAERLHGTGVPLIIDTSGPALHHAVRAPAALVKPSLNELRTVTGRDLLGIDQYESAARDILRAGRCGALAVSLGADGALVVPRDSPSFAVRAPTVTPLSSIGAGDSMVAAMALALSAGASLLDAARLGVAAGTAAVLVPGVGLCHPDDVERLLPLVTVAHF